MRAGNRTQRGGQEMRRTLDLLTWVLMLLAVTSIFYLASAPDVEAALGIPACKGLPHHGPCRLCVPSGRCKLPRVIDADNLRLVQTPNEAPWE